MLSILIIAVIVTIGIWYYKVYTAPVIRYRGEIYMLNTADLMSTEYQSADGTISITKTNTSSTVCMNYKWYGIRCFKIQQTIEIADMMFCVKNPSISTLDNTPLRILQKH